MRSRGRRTQLIGMAGAFPAPAIVTSSDDYETLMTVRWNNYANTQAALDALDGGQPDGTTISLGSYSGGYLNIGYGRSTWVGAELYKLEAGCPVGTGKSMRMTYPCANELSGGSPGPETGGPYAFTNWHSGLVGPNGMLTLEPLTTQGWSIFHLWRRFSVAADNPTNGISLGYTVIGDNGIAQKFGHGSRAGGSGYDSGGHRKVILGSNWNEERENGDWNDVGGATHYNTSPGSTLQVMRNPIDSVTDHDGWWHDVYAERRLDDGHFVMYAAVRLEYKRDSSPVTSPTWKARRIVFDNSTNPTDIAPTGIEYWRTHQNRNGRVSSGTQYEWMSDVEMVDGSVAGGDNARRFFDHYELPGLDLPGWD